MSGFLGCGVKIGNYFERGGGDIWYVERIVRCGLDGQSQGGTLG